MKRTTLAAVAAATMIAGGAAAFGPAAMAAGCPSGSTCGGSVNATLTVPESLTLTITSGSSLALADSALATPGTAPDVTATVKSNDATGYTVSVQAGGNLVNQSNSAFSIPIGDLFAWGGSQSHGNYTNDGFGHVVPDPLSAASALTTDASSTVSDPGNTNGGADSITDYFGFVGSSVYTGWNGTGAGGNGAGVPNAPAGSYQAALTYLLAGN